jgi:voltage-gated potassium channel
VIYQRFSLFRDFLRAFARNVSRVGEVILSLLVLILLGGVAISHFEKIRLGDAIYFALITGLSIGYGDITPATGWGRAISVSIGLTGMVFVGITVAIATHALAEVTQHILDRDSKGK